MNYNTPEWIKVTGVDLRKLIAAVYANSRPQGPGIIHAQDGPIPENVLEQIMLDARIQGKGLVVGLDYVLGRACKFNLYRDEQDDLFIRRKWYDHSELDLHRMLRDSGMKEDLANA